MALQDFKVKNGLVTASDVTVGTSIVRGQTAGTTVGLFDTSTGAINLGGTGSTVTIQNLTVSGTTTTLNTQTLDVADINITLAKNSTTDAGANGGGITLKGASDKTITWDNTNANWTSSEHFNIASGKLYKINNVQISASNLSNGTTGSGSIVLATTPTIGTSMYVPIVYGQSSTGGSLTLKANSTDTTGSISLNSATIDSSALTSLFATPTSVTEFAAATTLTIGGASGAQTVTIGGASTGASTYNFGTGVTGNATVKTLNVGTGGGSGSTTNINIGSTNTGTITVNSTVKISGLTTNGVVYTSGSTGQLNSAARTLWGQTFDGSANITGALSSVGSITFATGADYIIDHADEAAARNLTIGGQVNSLASGTGGSLNLKGGEESGATAPVGGNINIIGGVASSGAAVAKTGGSVYIDGGGVGATGTPTYGSIYIGTQTNGTTVGTSTITIGKTGTTTTLAGTLSLPSNSLSLTNLPQVAAYNFLGNVTAGSANVTAVTPDNAITMINQGTTTINAARITTLNQNTTGSAATLTTSRSIHGGSFNGSADVTNVITSTYGGTGNGFTKFTGPTTAEKTFTLPDASATLLYSGGALGTPSGGTLTNCTFPTLNQSTTGTAGGLTGTPNISVGTIAGTQLTLTGNLNIGTTGGDYGRTWRTVIRQDQDATTQLGIINGTVGVSSATQISRIGGTANSFCDWILADANGSPYDYFNYGSAVQYVKWGFGSTERLRLTSTGNLTITSSTFGVSTGLIISGGDITAARTATTGVVYFGTSGNKYLYFDGTNYNMPGGNLYANGSLVLVSGGALGTPSSGTLTNCTFPTLNQNTTGSAGSVANALTAGTGLSASSSYNGSAAITFNVDTAAAGTPSIYSTLTTGSLSVAAGLTTGQVNIANGATALGTSQTTTAVNILSGAMTVTTSGTRTVNIGNNGTANLTTNINLGTTATASSITNINIGAATTTTTTITGTTKLASLTTNAVVTTSGGTGTLGTTAPNALAFTAGTLSLAGNLSTTGAYAVSFTIPGAFTYTFPSATKTLASTDTFSTTTTTAGLVPGSNSVGSSYYLNGSGAWSQITLPAGQTAGSATSGYLQYAGTTKTSGQLDGGSTLPSNTTRLNYDGNFYATTFYGSAAGLTSLPISGISATGTASSTTYLRGDGSWQTVSGGATLSAVDASTTYYLGLSAGSSGSWTDARVDTSNLYYTSGDQTLFSTNFNSASDVKLKYNIHTIENPIGTLKQLEGVEFNWKTTGKKSYGVIAQELEKILPELVNTVDDTKSVNYQALIGFLIEAVKELSIKVERLENDI